jgi:hypothetical protein
MTYADEFDCGLYFNFQLLFFVVAAVVECFNVFEVVLACWDKSPMAILLYSIFTGRELPLVETLNVRRPVRL